MATNKECGSSLFPGGVCAAEWEHCVVVQLWPDGVRLVSHGPCAILHLLRHPAARHDALLQLQHRVRHEHHGCR